ncbi:MAG: ATP-binding protein, partial [Gemmatimonadota bacterium]
RRLMHDEQMSVTGKLAAAVAHEINNPLGVVTLYSQHALNNLAPDHPAYPHLQTIHRNAERCRKIIGELLSLARPRRPERRRVDLRWLCREVMDSVRLLAEKAGVRISSGRYARDAPIWIEADSGMLLQAVLNLAVNAIEATAKGNEVFVEAYEAHDRDATVCIIEVRDTGAGIAADQLEQVFQPFFTTKATGTGLGLSIAENVIQSHHGRIDVHSAVGAGTTFRLVLPRVEPIDTGSRA